MKKVIFIVEYEAKQPLFLRTEGVYDVATRRVGDKEVPSIISRKMIRPLRDTLRTYARQTDDPWIKGCEFPTETMCCYCIDCLMFGGTNASAGTQKELTKGKKVKFNVGTLQLRSLVHPSDALAVSSGEEAIESETHTGVKEGRHAEIGRALFSPFQVSQGTRFIGTFMLDIVSSGVKKPGDLVNLFATIFMHTKRYGARTAQEGLVEPKILAVVDVPYEVVTSYDLYKTVINYKIEDWKPEVDEYLQELKKIVPELSDIDYKILTETNLLALLKEDRLLGELRKALEKEGVRVEKA
ncbi:MAG: type I-D CRISPR-associated protein Cas7/Csc2 [Candidatus Edwardsbacteria bacterium]